MNIKVLAGLTLTVLSAHATYASRFTAVDLEQRSFAIANQLNVLAQTNSTDLCAGDVLVAAAYIEAAGRELQRDAHQTARTSLTYGHNELKEISTTRSYCTHLAAEVKPYFAQVILLKSDLEHEPAPEPDHTSD